MRVLRRALPFAAGVALLVARPSAAPAATVTPLSLSALTARAERIVVSEVLEVRAEPESGRGDHVPLTLVTVRVERTLKGAGGGHLVLEFLGGRVEADSLDIFDVPRFAVGDRDVLFLAGGSRQVSPLVGVMRGRFRIQQGEGGARSREQVAFHDGRPLTEAELGDDLRVVRNTGSPSPHGGLVSLDAFEKAILARVAVDANAGRGRAASAPSTAAQLAPTRQPDESDGPLEIAVNLGSSPALLDGCPDWNCALASKTWFQRLTRGEDASGDAPPERSRRVALEWGQAVFGRLLDTDTLALSFVRTTRGERSAAVVFNERLPWNAYADAAGAPLGADEPLDLPSVAGRELSIVAAAWVAEGGASGPALRGARPSAGGPPSRAVAASDRLDPAASGCGAADVFVDPHLLAFDSPDHALMTAYQVGFFQPGAASPAQIVDVPLGAFLVRRVIDLPAWAVSALQTSLVADIRLAGLGTPIGVVYTYRVRGVWAGGTTVWSDSSQPFVRCSASTVVAR